MEDGRGTDEMTIQYFNTDLDLVSAQDLSQLADALEARGVSPVGLNRGKDRLWYSCLEVDEEFINDRQPEQHIVAMLDVIESLPPPLHAAWRKCTVREFCIGYGCGDEPWAFNQGLSNTTLRRIAEVGATLRITIYPERYPEGNKGHDGSGDRVN